MTASLAPSWPAILAVLIAVWIVCIVALWAHPTPAAAAASGRHRPGRTAEPDVFDRVLAETPVRALLTLVDPDDDELPYVVPVALNDCWPADDWTADLPTEAFPVLVVDEPAAEQRHTSPSERARERWGVECPIFAGLAETWKYDGPGSDVTPPVAVAA